MAAAQKPMVSDERPAKSNTERTSRPRLSVPNGCCQDGGCSDGEPMSAGPPEANHGANTDSSEIATRMTRPIPPKRVRNRRRSTSKGPAVRNRFDGTDMTALGSADISFVPTRHEFEDRAKRT